MRLSLWDKPINFNKSVKVLHLGPGNSKIENTISIDINSKSNPTIIWDLNKTPWPFEENFFDIEKLYYDKIYIIQVLLYQMRCWFH
jgi:hypothetical protein